MFVPNKPFQPSAMKHSGLLGSFLSYKYNEMLWIGPSIALLGYFGVILGHFRVILGHFWGFFKFLTE